MSIKDYYGKDGEAYFKQRERYISDHVQEYRSKLFCDFVSSSDIVLDFGCGSGGVLGSLHVKRKIGIEISDYAVAKAQELLDNVFPEMTMVDTNSIDLIISYHALEHVENPSKILREMYRVLVPEGKAKIVVPLEQPIVDRGQTHWTSNPEMHLFSWTPVTLGNLFVSIGFQVIDSYVLPNSSVTRRWYVRLLPTFIVKILDYAKAIYTGKFHTVLVVKK